MKLRNAEDLDGRCGSSYAKPPYLNREENDVKGPHATRQKLRKSREASRRKSETNRAEEALAGRPGPSPGWFVTPFDLDDARAIYSPHAKLQLSSHSSFATEEQRSLRDTTPERLLGRQVIESFDGKGGVGPSKEKS